MYARGDTKAVSIGQALTDRNACHLTTIERKFGEGSTPYESAS